jgi:hypothetical protein
VMNQGTEVAGLHLPHRAAVPAGPYPN